MGLREFDGKDAGVIGMTDSRKTLDLSLDLFELFAALASGVVLRVKVDNIKL